MIVDTDLEVKKELKESMGLKLEKLSKDLQKEQIKYAGLLKDVEYINNQLEIVRRS